MYQYSFANVDMILEIPNESGDKVSYEIKGFATGENLINIMRRAPIASVNFGAYGDMVVNMQRILAGDVTFSVLMNAPENAALQRFANHFQAQADADGKHIVPISGKLVDNMGKDEATFTNGVILAMPAMSRGQTMNTVTWVLTFEKVEMERNVGKDLTEI